MIARSRTREGWKDIGKLAMTVGLGAALTGVFGLWSGVLAGRQKALEQQCSVAQQIVLDEALNPALKEDQRGRLNALAMRRIELCLGERT